jgi:hypothetical protein
MLTIVALPSSTLTDVFASIGTLTTDLWVLIAVAIGVPLAFYVIRQVIGLLPKARARRQ